MPKAAKSGTTKNAPAGEGRLRRARGDAKLATLYRALLSEIARVGAFGVTHRAVAKEAGVSLSATTYYFKSKQDMVQKAFVFLSEGVHETIEKLVAAHGKGASAEKSSRENESGAAAQFVRSRLQADVSENLTFIELMMTAARDVDTRRLLATEREATRSFVVALMEDSHSERPDEDADLMMALASGLILESLARGRPKDFEARAIAIAERVMRCVVGTDPENVPKKGKGK